MVSLRYSTYILVLEPFYFYAAAVDRPDQIDRYVIAEARALYYEKEEEGYGDVNVVLCKSGARREDVSRIAERYHRDLNGIRSMELDSKIGRISMHMK